MVFLRTRGVWPGTPTHPLGGPPWGGGLGVTHFWGINFGGQKMFGAPCRKKKRKNSRRSHSAPPAGGGVGQNLTKKSLRKGVGWLHPTHPPIHYAHGTLSCRGHRKRSTYKSAEDWGRVGGPRMGIRDCSRRGWGSPTHKSVAPLLSRGHPLLSRGHPLCGGYSLCWGGVRSKTFWVSILGQIFGASH